MSELFLVRHAQASFGSDNYDQLSALGVRQSRILGAYFDRRDISFDHLVAGDMQRQRQTLDGICEGHERQNALNYRSHPGLNEYDFKTLVDAYSRRNPDDVLVREAAAAPSDAKAFYRLLRQVLMAWSEGKIDAPSETWPEFLQRVMAARSMLHEMAEAGNRILVVSSGGAISQFVGTVLDLAPARVFDLNLQLRNTGISRFYFNRHKISLAELNGVPHLDRPEYADLITYA